MGMLRKVIGLIALTLLFCMSFSLLDLLKGREVEYVDNLIQAVCTVCIMGVLKVISRIREQHSC